MGLQGFLTLVVLCFFNVHGKIFEGLSKGRRGREGRENGRLCVRVEPFITFLLSLHLPAWFQHWAGLSLDINLDIALKRLRESSLLEMRTNKGVTNKPFIHQQYHITRLSRHWPRLKKAGQNMSPIRSFFFLLKSHSDFV
jgi:hypothetical protein